MKKKDRLIKLNILFMAVLAVFVFCTFKSKAEDDSIDDFIQTVFTEDDGFESGEANCICQSQSGYIWIGTDSGLYRYDGSDFVLTSLDEDQDGSRFSINCVMLSNEGMLYVGTEKKGLYQYDNGKFYQVNAANNAGIVTVNDICQDEDGVIWLATSFGVFQMNDNVVTAISEGTLPNDDVTDIEIYGDAVYGIANNDTIFRIKGQVLDKYVNKGSYNVDDLNCIFISEGGNRYYGTMGNSILEINSAGNYEVIDTGYLSGINKIWSDGKKTWVLSDTGLAFLNENNKLNLIADLKINESLSDIAVDFEGNYWITSYRKGLLFLERSKFTNCTRKYGLDDSIVNCVTTYNDCMYVGTDDGLTIIDENDKVVLEDELSQRLSGVSIRDFYKDNQGNLWICTYKIYGVIKLSKTGDYIFYNRGNTGIISNSVNTIIALSNGYMALGTENGISLIKDGSKTINISSEDGIENEDIISLYENEGGIVYAGSNGSGMYHIDLSGVKPEVSLDESLQSGGVYCFAKGENGIWIGTDNGLYYMEGTARQITAIDSSTSIADIINTEGYIWIFGSKGVQKYYENDLLSKQSPKFESYTRNDGIISSVSTYSTSLITEDGIVYVCCDTGFCSFDSNNVFINEVAPKVRISSINVDGTQYKFSDLNGIIKVPANTSRISIKFSVLSYVNHDDVDVSYYLKGFEKQRRHLTGTDALEVEYTNLEGGKYNFVLSAENADGIKCQENITFTIEKKLKFVETKTAKVLFIIAGVLLCFITIIVIRIIVKKLKRKEEEVAVLSEMSEKAQQSNKAKHDYVNYLSTELRAPLNAILANCEIMLRNSEGTQIPSQEDVNKVSSIYESSYEILGIVDGISRLSMLKDELIIPQEKEYAVSDIITELSPQFKELIDKDNVLIRVDIQDDIPNGLVGDEAMVKEIITNIFVRSAASVKEGSVSIAVSWRENINHNRAVEEEDITKLPQNEIYLDFVISDTGLGIKEERLDNVFELDDSYDRDDIGKLNISIGMAIARELISLLSGNATVTSVYGAGTTISFSIKQKVFDYAFVNYNYEKKKELALKNANSRIWLPDVRVLIVDDKEATLQVEKAIFDTYDMKVDGVFSGFEAIDQAMINNYDIIFINTSMPVMSGMDTVKEIRSLDEESYKKIPIIAMAENIVDTSRIEILEAGFDEVIVKPIEVSEIETIFRMFIDEGKIGEKPNIIEEYISQYDYREDIVLLQRYVDAEQAIKSMGGMIDTFNQVLVSFRTKYLEELDNLKDYIDEDVRKFKYIIHDIKSSSNNICAFAIERKAANIESAINIGNVQYAKENIRSFVALLKNMFREIDAYLDKIGKAKEEVKQQNHIDDQKELSLIVEIPDQEEQQEPLSVDDTLEATKNSVSKEKLLYMVQLMRENQSDEVKSLLVELEQYKYGELDTEFFAALSVTVNDHNYEAASDIIEQYINSV